MGGENIKENQKIKYYFNIWGIRKKKERKKGTQKKGVENSPFHLPWIHTCNLIDLFVMQFSTQK